MSNNKYKKTYKLKNIIKKLLIQSILIMLVICSFNITSLAEYKSSSPIIIDQVISPDSAIEREEIKINVLIKNNGTENITQGKINVSLYVDNESLPKAINRTSENIDINETKSINITWITELGDEENRILNITVEYKGDNEYFYKTIKIIQRNTDLTFYSDISIDGQARVNKTLKIKAIAQNIGKSTTEEINASLFIDGKYHQSIMINGLNKDERYNLYYYWTPKNYGTYIINISLDRNNEIQEQDDSNNYCEINIDIELERFDWWNLNWHYRKSYKTIGTGNISIEMNFTKYLRNFNITGESFENDTIVIVKYQLNGEFAGAVEEFYFNESVNFDPINNATGILSWYVDDNYFYFVYFDLICNTGDRAISNETIEINTTNQGVSIDFIGSEEGWWSEWAENMEPLNNYYLPNEDEMKLKILTKAIAFEVIAKFQWENTEPEFLNLNSLDGTYWLENKIFAKIGNCTMTIIASDNAGYQNIELTHNFYVGYPDLIINSLDISSFSSQFGTFYEGTDITIKANISSFNTTVNNVNISLFIDRNYISSKYMDVKENLENIVSFIYSFEENGKYNIEIYVDYNDDISETNEFNNSVNQDIIIEGTPDIGITDLKLPSKNVFEGDRVEFTVRIHNYGIGNATHYRVNLYIEQNDENNDDVLDESMNFIEEKNHTFVDLKINKTKNITLIWDSAEYGEFEGEWIVGVKVISNSSNPDSNVSNNNRSSLPNHLIVIETIPHEKIKPVIQIIKPKSSEIFEEGEIVEIRTRITDNSGIKNVKLEIIDPENNKFSNEMIIDEDNEYFYEFDETNILGRYFYNITAVDNSFYENNATVKNNFVIVEDNTPPKIKDFRASPSRQLKNEDVKITCIVKDYSDLKNVEVTIVYPDTFSKTNAMEETNIEDKYIHTESFDILGKYTYYISAEDKLGNNIDTKENICEFWITNDLEDTDSDGIPDWWEEKYGFNPFDPTDALNDEDDDGFTNIEEYKEGTNPLKPVTFSERIGIKLKENWPYLITSFILFIILIFLSFYGLRREIS